MTQPLPMSDLLITPTLLEQVSSFYENFDIQSILKLSEIYSEDVEFLDPIASHKGLVQLRHYFERLLKGCTSCRFDIKEAQIGKEQGWIRWRMLFSHPRLNGGKIIEIDGMSILKISNNKIHYQRDFYDLGAMIYEQLPLIGGIVSRIRKRMA